MSRKTFPRLAWDPKTFALYETFENQEDPPAPHVLIIPPGETATIQTPDGPLVIEPAWQKHQDEILGPLIALQVDDFHELCDLKSRLVDRNPRPRNLERDQHFRALNDAGWSPAKIAKMDALARAEKLAPEAVRSAIRRLRARERARTPKKF
jgi:hypothetical protein